MLIGLDIWSAPPDAPLDGLSVGMQELIRNSALKRLPFVVIHEHIHALQVFAREDTLLDMALAEVRTVEFLLQWVPAGKSPMCGNSICQDRRFMHRLMPRLRLPPASLLIRSKPSIQMVASRAFFLAISLSSSRDCSSPVISPRR